MVVSSEAMPGITLAWSVTFAPISMAVPATSPTALGEMNVTREKPAAVDKARKQQRGADHRLLGVEIAAVLPWRNGANTLILRRTIGTAKIRRQGINRLRGQRRATRVSERLLPFEPRLKLRLARQAPDRAHERIHGNGDSRQILRTRFETRQVPVHDERIAED